MKKKYKNNPLFTTAGILFVIVNSIAISMITDTENSSFKSNNVTNNIEEKIKQNDEILESENKDNETIDSKSDNSNEILTDTDSSNNLQIENNTNDTNNNIINSESPNNSSENENIISNNDSSNSVNTPSNSSPADTNANENTNLPLKAICKDGAISYQDDPNKPDYRGMCSGHGGIAQKLGRVK